MANEKIFNARFKQKHDTQANWQRASFIPLAGEIIIYDKDENNSLPRVKIGDGETQINELPFVDEGKMDYKGAIDNLSNVTGAKKGDTYKPTIIGVSKQLTLTISGVESILPLTSYEGFENYGEDIAIINCNANSDIGKFLSSAYYMVSDINYDSSWNIKINGWNWGSVWLTTSSFDPNYEYSIWTNLTVSQAQQKFANGNVAICTIEIPSCLPTDLQNRLENVSIINNNGQLYMYDGSGFIPLGGEIVEVEDEGDAGLAGKILTLKKIGFTSECDYVATPTDGRTAFQDAIAAAADGDTILVLSGEYNGTDQLLIDKNISFVAVGHPVINFPVKTQGGGVFSYENWEWTEIYEGKHTKWDGFTFNNSFRVGIECNPNMYYNGFTTVKNCNFYGEYNTFVGNFTNCAFNTTQLIIGHYYGADESTFTDCKFSSSIEANNGIDIFTRCDFYFNGNNSINITTQSENNFKSCKMYAPNDILTIQNSHGGEAINLNDTVIFAVSVVNGSQGEITGGYLVSYTPIGGTSSGDTTAEYVTRTEMETYVNETIIGDEW